MQAIGDIMLDDLEERAYRDGVQSVRLGGQRVLYVRQQHCWACRATNSANHKHCPAPRYFLWTGGSQSMFWFHENFEELSRAEAEALLN